MKSILNYSSWKIYSRYMESIPWVCCASGNVFAHSLEKVPSDMWQYDSRPPLLTESFHNWVFEISSYHMNFSDSVAAHMFLMETFHLSGNLICAVDVPLFPVHQQQLVRVQPNSRYLRQKCREIWKILHPPCDFVYGIDVYLNLPM